MIRAFALVSLRNEIRHIAMLMGHYKAEGVQLVVRDQGSNDGTHRILRESADMVGEVYRDIEVEPFNGWFSQVESLEWKVRKMNYLRHLFPDDELWFISIDADELIMSSRPGERLIEGIERLSAAGYDEVCVLQAVFVATRDNPEAYHPMRCYYPMTLAGRGNLVFRFYPGTTLDDAGKTVNFPPAPDDITRTVDFYRTAPETWVLRHYYFLGYEHAIKKWSKPFHPGDPSAWHNFGYRPPRARIKYIQLLDDADPRLRHWDGRSVPDVSNPFKQHICYIDKRDD